MQQPDVPESEIAKVWLELFGVTYAIPINATTAMLVLAQEVKQLRAENKALRKGEN